MNNRNVNLDLLRAIAISMVFLAHSVLSFGAPAYLAPLQLGGIGVDLFFVLSGWLIGTQIFSELNRFGTLHIRRFWVRRWMRTLPAYYVVLIYTIIQQYITKDTFEFPYSYLFFIQNYDDNLPIFYVSWSLSVEEQFYLLVAPLLALLSKVNKNTRLMCLLSLIVAPSAFRYFELYSSVYETHVRLDCCLMGVILADLHSNHKNIWLRLERQSSWLVIIATAMLAIFFINRWYPMPFVKEPSPLLLAIVFGLWIIRATLKQWYSNALFGRIVYYISSRSYAIYLLHPDGLAVTAKIISKDYFVLYIFTALTITVATAEILFRTVETYFMNLRSEFAISQPRKSV